VRTAPPGYWVNHPGSQAGQIDPAAIAIRGGVLAEVEMIQAEAVDKLGKAEFYRELHAQLRALLGDERDPIANAANTSALLFQLMPDLNWAGFYFLREGGELVLGPFQGKPACVRVAAGRGVCGAAVLGRRAILAEDVHVFPDHIACDVASRSELVVPLLRDGDILGVLDLDSPTPARFDVEDQAGLEKVAMLYISASASLVGAER
jgi:GAF domain-containing protein